MSRRDRIALTAAAVLAAFCACVHVARREAFQAAVAGLLAGDFASRARRQS